MGEGEARGDDPLRGRTESRGCIAMVSILFTGITRIELGVSAFDNHSLLCYRGGDLMEFNLDQTSAD